jgi:hypothetical protein
MFWVPFNILIDKQVATVIYYKAKPSFLNTLVTYNSPQNLTAPD